MNKIALQSRQRCIPRLRLLKLCLPSVIASVLQAASFAGLTRSFIG